MKRGRKGGEMISISRGGGNFFFFFLSRLWSSELEEMMKG